MALKIKRSGADEYGRTIKLLLAGEPGAGKSRLSSTFPNPFYANVEGGLMSVADRAVPYTDISSAEDLNALLQALRQTPKQREAILGTPVSTIIIDTIDAVQKLLIEERKRTEKKDAMAIADWGWLGDQLRLIVRNYRNLELNVVFTCHVKTESDAESGQTFVKPALQGAMGDEIAQYVDIVALLKASPVSKVKDGKTVRVLQRVIQTGPDARHPWLKDRSGKLPVEYDVNLVNDGTNLLAVIFGGAPAAPSEVISGDPSSGAPAAVKGAPKKVAQSPSPSPVAAEPEVASPAPVAEPEPSAVPVEQQELNAPEPPLEAEDVPASVVEASEPVAAPALQVVRDAPSPDMICTECGGAIESDDQRDLSMIRFRRALCRTDFVNAKQAQAKK